MFHLDDDSIHRGEQEEISGFRAGQDSANVFHNDKVNISSNTPLLRQRASLPQDFAPNTRLFLK